MWRAVGSFGARGGRRLAEGLGAVTLGDRLSGVVSCLMLESRGGPSLLLAIAVISFAIGVIAGCCFCGALANGFSLWSTHAARTRSGEDRGR